MTLGAALFLAGALRAGVLAEGAFVAAGAAPPAAAKPAADRKVNNIIARDGGSNEWRRRWKDTRVMEKVYSALAAFNRS